jgi:hypothetical protein
MGDGVALGVVEDLGPFSNFRQVLEQQITAVNDQFLAG